MIDYGSHWLASFVFSVFAGEWRLTEYNQWYLKRKNILTKFNCF